MKVELLKVNLVRKYLISETFNELLSWSPFDSPGSFNTVITGVSDSGKTLMVKEMISSMQIDKEQCFVVDIGQSYRGICDNLSGNFIQLKNIDLSLNPFSNINFSDKEETLYFVEFMTELVVAMTFANESNVNDFSKYLFTDAIKYAIQCKGNQAELQDIINFLTRHKNSLANYFATMLAPFAKTGIYGRYFNGIANVNLSNNFTVFELEGLCSRPRGIIFKTIMYLVSRKMYLEGKRKQISLVIDEAGDFIRDAMVAKAIEYASRMTNKYQGCLITLAQSITDFLYTEVTKSIYNRSYWNVVLEQNKYSLTEIINGNYLNLTSLQKLWVEGIKTEKRKYSEVLINGRKGETSLGRLQVNYYPSYLCLEETAGNVSLLRHY